MPTLDYIRIVGISDITSGGHAPCDVTFNIEYSGDAEFSVPMMGTITIRLTELVDTTGLGYGEIEKIASRLVRQVLVREKDKDGSIIILHILGLPLDEWLRMNIPLLKQ